MKKFKVIDEFGFDITNRVTVKGGRVTDEFGCDITNRVTVEKL